MVSAVGSSLTLPCRVRATDGEGACPEAKTVLGARGESQAGFLMSHLLASAAAHRIPRHESGGERQISSSVRSR